MRRKLLAILTVLFAALAVPAAAQDFPELTGRVVDAADILSPQEELALTSRLETLETESQRQFVIATIPDLQGRDIADYGYQLGRAWGIGDAERNDGVLLIVAPNDRKTRIEVGYGLEPILTDGYSTLLVQNQMLPRFRDGDYAGGIALATEGIISQLQLPEEEARKIASQATKQRKSDGGFPIGSIVWFAFLFFFFILPMFRGRGRRRRYSGGTGSAVGNIILWEVANAALRGASGGGGGGGGFGGGGFGGGGFSGGGGSFGGGGASGGW